MNKHKWLYLITAILICALGGSVYAAYSNSLNCHVEIIQEEGGGGGEQVSLAFYEDTEGCSTPINFLEYGSIERGSSKALTFRVKNTGTTAVTIKIGRAHV